VRLKDELPEWCSAKDVILEMLRRHDVKGGGEPDHRVLRAGAGQSDRDGPPRHREHGGRTWCYHNSFPSDETVRDFLRSEDREADWVELVADEHADYDVDETIDLSQIEPLIAKPSSPGNVVPVGQVAGQEIAQAVIGSSANPGLRDFAIVAAMVAGRADGAGRELRRQPDVARDLDRSDEDGRHNRTGDRRCSHPSSGVYGLHRHGPGARNRSQLAAHDATQLSRSLGHQRGFGLAVLAGTAAASALAGVITDPREWAREEKMDYPKLDLPRQCSVNTRDVGASGFFCASVPHCIRAGPVMMTPSTLHPSAG